MLILDLWGISFHAVVVFGLGKNLLSKSILGRCDIYLGLGQEIFSVLSGDLKKMSWSKSKCKHDITDNENLFTKWYKFKDFSMKAIIPLISKFVRLILNDSVRGYLVLERTFGAH